MGGAGGGGRWEEGEHRTRAVRCVRECSQPASQHSQPAAEARAALRWPRSPGAASSMSAEKGRASVTGFLTTSVILRGHLSPAYTASVGASSSRREGNPGMWTVAWNTQNGA